MKTKTTFYRGLLASVALTSLCFTANANPLKGWKPYVGAGAGYSVLDFKNDFYGKAPTFEPIDGSFSGTSKGAVGSLFFGVQKQINSMALGAELYGYLSQQNTKATSETLVQKGQRQYGYGLKLRAGYFVNPTALAYVHAGLESAKFKYSGSADVGNGNNTFKKSKSLVGVPLGVGLEVDVSSAWKARLEYTYTKYKSWKTGNVASIAGDVVQSKISPSQHSVMVGFSYQI